MSLHIHPQGKVELVLPYRGSERAGLAFIRSRQEWIGQALTSQKKREAIQKPIELVSGAHIPCFGDVIELSLTITPGQSRSRATLTGSTLTVRAGSVVAAHKAVEVWYRKEAMAYFVGQSHEYAEALGTSVGSIRVIQMKTQWGSCNRKTKALTFNWKLALAPEEIARYVVAHEVSHLLQANHSGAFWNVVKKIDPGYARHRAWLKAYGGGLYIQPGI